MPNLLNIDLKKVENSAYNMSKESFEDVQYYMYKCCDFVDTIKDKDENFLKNTKPKTADIPYVDLHRGIHFLIPYMRFDQNDQVKWLSSPECQIDPANLTEKQRASLEKELYDIEDAFYGKNNEKIEQLRKATNEIKLEYSYIMDRGELSSQEDLKKLWFREVSSQIIYSDFGYKNPKVFSIDGKGNKLSESELAYFKFGQESLMQVASVFQYASDKLGIQEQRTASASYFAHRNCKVIKNGEDRFLTKEEFLENVLAKGSVDLEDPKEFNAGINKENRKKFVKMSQDFDKMESKILIDWHLSRNTQNPAQTILNRFRQQRAVMNNNQYPNREYVRNLQGVFESLKDYGMLTKEVATQIQQEAKAKSLNPFYAFFTGKLAERSAQQKFLSQLDKDIKANKFPEIKVEDNKVEKDTNEPQVKGDDVEVKTETKVRISVPEASDKKVVNAVDTTKNQPQVQRTNDLGK